jgi:RNA polymerase sigma factor (sigma-70 family)
MLFQNPEILIGLQRVVTALVHDSIWREDLLQEALIHLWQSGPETANHSTSWHLQRCQFLVLDRLKSGRSLDAPKHRHKALRLSHESDDQYPLNHPSLQRSHVFQEVAARDIFDVLQRKLRPAESAVLELLAQGLNDNDIAQALKLDRSAVSRRRARIATLAADLGIHL